MFVVTSTYMYILADASAILFLILSKFISQIMSWNIDDIQEEKYEMKTIYML